MMATGQLPPSGAARGVHRASLRADSEERHNGCSGSPDGSNGARSPRSTGPPQRARPRAEPVFHALPSTALRPSWEPPTSGPASLHARPLHAGDPGASGPPTHSNNSSGGGAGRLYGPAGDGPDSACPSAGDVEGGDAPTSPQVRRPAATGPDLTGLAGLGALLGSSGMGGVRPSRLTAGSAGSTDSRLAALLSGSALLAADAAAGAAQARVRNGLQEPLAFPTNLTALAAARNGGSVGQGLRGLVGTLDGALLEHAHGDLLRGYEPQPASGLPLEGANLESLLRSLVARGVPRSDGGHGGRGAGPDDEAGQDWRSGDAEVQEPLLVARAAAQVPSRQRQPPPPPQRQPSASTLAAAATLLRLPGSALAAEEDTARGASERWERSERPPTAAAGSNKERPSYPTDLYEDGLSRDGDAAMPLGRRRPRPTEWEEADTGMALEAERAVALRRRLGAQADADADLDAKAARTAGLESRLLDLLQRRPQVKDEWDGGVVRLGAQVQAPARTSAGASASDNEDRNGPPTRGTAPGKPTTELPRQAEREREPWRNFDAPPLHAGAWDGPPPSGRAPAAQRAAAPAPLPRATDSSSLVEMINGLLDTDNPGVVRAAARILLAHLGQPGGDSDAQGVEVPHAAPPPPADRRQYAEPPPSRAQAGSGRPFAGLLGGGLQGGGLPLGAGVSLQAALAEAVARSRLDAAAAAAADSLPDALLERLARGQGQGGMRAWGGY
ncbi:hypothetical protein HYH03_002515 [Edaphochlamys debaryana]|uniref:Uncharacterized protein n=1 Tax=Edaphochlamys debaryana TaxID=47281 RepID=A0A836C477_9CHLO|nr:hypothetical protein HYH03_002515 [Edaphochlamys debaryana]|eukprot:KAG2499570.1 hypothetical protein HYH03_002515 [Edaphochlamys debaryana]